MIEFPKRESEVDMTPHLILPKSRGGLPEMILPRGALKEKIDDGSL